MFHFFKKDVVIPKHAFVAVVDGKLISLENVADPVFSQKMLGEGIAIIPRSEQIVAPCNGKITMIYPTLHAFGMTNEDGIQILVHIGIDTVNLKGRGFIQHVNIGDMVNANDKIISFDARYLTNKKLNLTTFVLFPNCEKHLSLKTSGNVCKGKDVVVTYN